jgi:hypothetical protein
VLLDVLFGRAVELFLEILAEMAALGVPHRIGNFRDAERILCEQLRRSFQPEVFYRILVQDSVYFQRIILYFFVFSYYLIISSGLILNS